MTITAAQNNAVHPGRYANGSYTDDASSPAAMAIKLGFKPRYIRMVNQTTRVMFEWFDGMTSAHAIKTVAVGTRTAETSGGIVVAGDKVTFPAAAQNDQVRWDAMG